MNYARITWLQVCSQSYYRGYQKVCEFFFRYTKVRLKHNSSIVYCTFKIKLLLYKVYIKRNSIISVFSWTSICFNYCFTTLGYAFDKIAVNFGWNFFPRLLHVSIKLPEVRGCRF